MKTVKITLKIRPDSIKIYNLSLLYYPSTLECSLKRNMNDTSVFAQIRYYTLPKKYLSNSSSVDLDCYTDSVMYFLGRLKYSELECLK